MTGKVLHYLLQERHQFGIPGIGKFSMEDVPAEIQPGTAMLKAPGKMLAFSPKPWKEHYSLRNLLPEAFSMLPAHAQKVEDQFSAEIRNSLKENRRYSIAGFGTLLADTEGTIQFVPDTSVHQISDAFGLRPLPARQLVIRHQAAEEKETPVIPLRPFDSENDHSKKPFRLLSYAAAGLGILMAAGSLFWLNQTGGQQTGPQAAVFSSAANQNSQKMAARPAVEIKEKTTGINPSAYGTASYSLRYFVIAGSFQYSTVANDASMSWQQKGFETAHHFCAEKKMTRISIGSFDSKEAALDFLEKNKAGFSSPLWILQE